MWTRRAFLKAGALTGAALLAPGLVRAAGDRGRGLTPFVDPLPIPRVLTPDRATFPGVSYYRIAMTEFRQRLHRDLPPSVVWGYHGGFPGPTIAARRDERVRVKWINNLRDETGALRQTHYLPVDTCLHGPHRLGPGARTVVHLHGGHVPPASDGFPEATMLPGQQVTYNYPNRQQAATLWYHDHALGITRLNVYMGLVGFYLLSDPVERALNLPGQDQDIPLMVQDRSFGPDGALAYPARWEEEFFGETILVNGKVWPYLDVTRRKYRFRLLNGSNARTYTFYLDSGQPFYQIGTDGGLLPAPVELKEITLAPAERAEVIIDFSKRAGEVHLLNKAPAPYPDGDADSAIRKVMQFRILGAGSDKSALPAALRPLTRLQEADAVRERDLHLDEVDDECVEPGMRWLINGRHWDDITEYPVLGTTEIWRFINPSIDLHPMHIHLVQFQILDRQRLRREGGELLFDGPRVPPAPQEAGWKDTVAVHPMESVRVIARFSDYTGRYPYHCHVLEHEDHEMMRQFEVVAKAR